MRVCLVGGTGTISTAVVPALLALGHEVTLFNRGQRAATVATPSGVRVIVGDRQDRPAFEAAMQAERFDAAIDFIAYNAEDAASSRRAFRDVRHFVHVSTVDTYGVQFDFYPTTEDHPLRPITGYGRNKVAADADLLAAYHRDGFPVTIVKPACMFGGTAGPRRQLCRDLTYIDRIRHDLPVLIVDGGKAFGQFLHADDAAPAFAHMLGRERCIGQVYNLCWPHAWTWEEHHRALMTVLGHEVELISLPLDVLATLPIPGREICLTNYAFHRLFSPAKLLRDVPEFRPRLGLVEMIERAVAPLDAAGLIPAWTTVSWEDPLIAAMRGLRDMPLPMS